MPTETAQKKVPISPTIQQALDLILRWDPVAMMRHGGVAIKDITLGDPIKWANDDLKKFQTLILQSLFDEVEGPEETPKKFVPKKKTLKLAEAMLALKKIPDGGVLAILLVRAAAVLVFVEEAMKA